MASDDLRASVDAVVRRGLAFEVADPDSVPVEITNSVVEIIRDITVPLRDELARLQGELATLTADRDHWEQAAARNGELYAACERQRDEARTERDIELARVGSVRSLHQRCECRRELDISLTPIVHCDCCDEDWPCSTVQTLDAPPRGLSAPYCGAYMTEWVCTLPPGRHPGWRHVDADGNWWDQTRCPTDCGEPVYRHAANGCLDGPRPAHSCGNCDGIDPDTCPFNPTRTKETPS